MVRDAAVAPGVFLHGDLGASCAAALAVRSSGAARGPVLSAADRAACWRRDVLLSGIFGHHAVAAVLDLDVPAAEALGLLPHFATLLLFRSGVHTPASSILDLSPADSLALDERNLDEQEGLTGTATMSPDRCNLLS